MQLVESRSSRRVYMAPSSAERAATQFFLHIFRFQGIIFSRIGEDEMESLFPATVDLMKEYATAIA